MPKITLKPKEEKLIQTPAIFLSIIDASANFKVESPKFGVLAGEIGRQYELIGITQVMFVNHNDFDISIDYEIANIKISGGAKSAVAVTNEVVVKKIIDAIRVESSATIDNGKVSKLVCNVTNAVRRDLTSIPAINTVKIFDTRAMPNRKILIQLVTDSPTISRIRVGTTSFGTKDNGIILVGNIDSPASYEFETEEEVFIYNETGTPAKIEALESWREDITYPNQPFEPILT